MGENYFGACAAQPFARAASPRPPHAHRAERPTHAASELGGDGAPRACVEHRRPAPSLSLCPLPRRSSRVWRTSRSPWSRSQASPSRPRRAPATMTPMRRASQPAPATHLAPDPWPKSERVALKRWCGRCAPGQVRGEGGDGGAEQDELADGADPNLPGQHRRARAAAGPVCTRQGEVTRPGIACDSPRPPSHFLPQHTPPPVPIRAQPRGPNTASRPRVPHLHRRLSHPHSPTLPTSPCPLTLTPDPRPTHEPCTHTLLCTRKRGPSSRPIRILTLTPGVYLTPPYSHLTPDT